MRINLCSVNIFQNLSWNILIKILIIYLSGVRENNLTEVIFIQTVGANLYLTLSVRLSSVNQFKYNGNGDKGFSQLLLNIDSYIFFRFHLLMSSTQFTILFVRRIVDNDMKDMGFLLAVYLVPIWDRQLKYLMKIRFTDEHLLFNLI